MFMKNLLLSLSFVLACGMAMAAEETMSFEELDVDQDGVVTLTEAEAHAPLHEHMQSSGMSELSKQDYEEWQGMTSH
jgi:hypothetical protein